MSFFFIWFIGKSETERFAEIENLRAVSNKKTHINGNKKKHTETSRTKMKVCTQVDDEDKYLMGSITSKNNTSPKISKIFSNENLSYPNEEICVSKLTDDYDTSIGSERSRSCSNETDNRIRDNTSEFSETDVILNKSLEEGTIHSLTHPSSNCFEENIILA